MGNRAVIAFGPGTNDPEADGNMIGVYVHWNGGRASVEAMLQAAKELGIRGPGTDSYSPARFCQIVGNWFGGSLSVGVDILSRCDCDNGDNGVYYVDKNWKIVGRAYAPPIEEVDPQKTQAIRKQIIAWSKEAYSERKDR